MSGPAIFVDISVLPADLLGATRKLARKHKQAIADLLKPGLVEYALPENPNSCLQEYRYRKR